MKEADANTLGPQKRILVVDDSEIMRVCLSDSLALNGYEVVTATNGIEGLELFLQDKFDLVITDCKMPGIDGLHLADIIKERSSDTPVLMITGQSRDEILAKMKTGQVDFLMFKPFGLEELHHIVQSFLVDTSLKLNAAASYDHSRI